MRILFLILLVVLSLGSLAAAGSIRLAAAADAGREEVKATELSLPEISGRDLVPNTVMTVQRVAATAHAEAYWQGSCPSNVKKAIGAGLEAFEREVYEPFTRNLVSDPLDDRTKSPIALVFTPLLLPRQLSWMVHFPQLRDRLGRDVIAVDPKALSDRKSWLRYLAHELQHVFRSYRQPSEEHWLDEGLSKFAEYAVVGDFPSEELGRAIDQASNLTLAHDFVEASGVNYFQSFLFVYYLKAHFGGIPLVRKLMLSPEIGSENIDAALAPEKADETDPIAAFRSFTPAFLQFTLAELFNPFASLVESDGLLSLGLDGEINREQSLAGASAEAKGSSGTYRVAPLASRYLKLRGCMTASTPANFPGVVTVADFLRQDGGPQIVKVRPGERTCVGRGDGPGKFLVLSNLDRTAAEFYVEMDAK